MIEIIAAATSTLCPDSGIRPCLRASSERMNENSPICARPRATVSAVRAEWPSSATMSSAANGLAIRMMASAARIISGSRTTNAGSKSIPTDTKNSTAKASRIGSASAAA